MQNVFAVKSVKSMPCKAIGGKETLIKIEETFAKRPVLQIWPTCDFFFFFLSLLSKRAEKLQNWGSNSCAK